MLTIMVGVQDAYDEEAERFVEFGGYPVYLEHSLISISKWEETHEKSFLSSEKTDDEMLDYIRFMILPETPNPNVLHLIKQKEIAEITAYMQSSRSGTTFAEKLGDKPNKNERITSEQIYSWMAAQNIDWRAENWHIQRLLNLIRICNINAQKDPNKKNQRVSGSSALANRRAMNQARRAQNGSTG